MISFHFEGPEDGWTQAVAKHPAGTWVKFFQAEMAREARRHNPGIKTIKRHWIDNQAEFLNASDKKAAARRFFDRFIDGTFMTLAPFVDAVESLNEIYAPDAATQANSAAWDIAALEVWSREYRTRPGLSHIRLIAANIAVGNDAPVSVAQACQRYDGIMGYHAYVPVRNGVILPDEYRHYSGRWEELDRVYRQAGHQVRWLFTEIGAVGYNGPGVALAANDGWRHPNVYGGDIGKYIAMLEYWAGKVQAWNAANGGRALGGQIFTSGSFGWEHYEVRQPEMNQIAEQFRNWSVPVPAPVPVPVPVPAPVPVPPAPGRGAPRTQYDRIYWRIDERATIEQYLEVCKGAFALRRTVGFSVDDAMVGDLDRRTMVEYGDQYGRAELEAFRDSYYPGVAIEFQPLPAVGGPMPELVIDDIVNDLPQHATLDYDTRPLSDITHLVIHHSVSPPDRPTESIAAYHVNTRGWPGIGYHFMVKADGRIEQTNYLETVSYHCGGQNHYSVGICLQGDFTASAPPESQQNAARALVGHLKGILGQLVALPHRGMPGQQTACPGATWEAWIGNVTG